jgi:YidC/Oxa1 family membrane protein insertase
MFTSIIVQPLYNVLVGFTTLSGDMGVGIVLMTIAIRLVLYPLSHKTIASQQVMQEIQPKLKELQTKHKGDRETLGRATMELYKEHKVNPFASCLPLLIQMPILIGIFWALQEAVLGTESLSLLYAFMVHPAVLEPTMLGLINLAVPSIPLAIMAGAAQWWTTRMLVASRPPPSVAKTAGKDESMMANMNKQMMIFMPIMTVVFGATLPAGLSLYWLFSTLAQGLQQHLIFKKTRSAKGA